MVSRPDGRRVTVRDIAAQTGVSIATVSRVLNGRDHVAPQTRDLVRAAVAETLALHGRTVLLDAGTAAQQASVLPSLPSRPGVAGAIVILPPEPGEQLAALRARGFPL